MEGARGSTATAMLGCAAVGVGLGLLLAKCLRPHAAQAATPATPAKTKPVMPAAKVKPRRPGVGCGVFVLSAEHEGCVLLGRRKGSDGSGTWALPGGHVELFESWEETSIREVAEETGLDITNVRYVTVNNSVDEAADYHYITIFMAGDVKGASEARNMEPDKCEGWHWVRWDDPKFPQPLFCALMLIRKNGLLVGLSSPLE